jgi:CDP-diacylglycerol---serine O-phosphatidyltransferase
VQKTHEDASYFKGLPIPAAASFIAAMILFVESWDGSMQIRSALIIAMIYSLSFLMVSTLHYYSFKKFDIRNRKPFNVLLSIILVSLIIAYKPKVMLFLILFAYVAIRSCRHFLQAFQEDSFQEGRARSEGRRAGEVRDEATAKRARTV